MSEKDTDARPTSNDETSRRGYLLGAGAALGSLGLLNGASGRAAAASEYETITVGAGETFRKNVGTGETWENKLIDISASGATYQIQADGTDWTIRNIGITGHYEGGHTEPFRARVTDSEGTGRIENVCIDVTCGDSNATGLYVYWNHAGHLEVDRFNVQNWTDNGIYASGPGNSDSHSIPGAGGTVAIRNAYSKNNDKSNFRLGTQGSTLENCCAAGGSSRGHWQFYESAEIIDCDLGGHTSDIALGDAIWEKSNDAGVECTNSRWESEHPHGGASTSNISGTSQGSPRDYVPEGCPTTAEEAASGGGSDGGETEEPKPEPERPEGAHLVAFVTEPDASFAAHEFYADGAVEFAQAPYDSPSGGSIEGGTYVAEDFVEEVDGSWHAGGITGGGNGDAYQVEGPITSVTVDKPDVMWIELDGEEVTEEELVSRTGGEPGDGEEDDEPVDGTLEATVVETNEPAGGERFTLTATIENPGDTVAEGDVRLLVGSGGDGVDATDVSLEGGAAETVTLGYETYPVQQAVEFPVRVETDDDADERTVAVSAATEGNLDVSIDGANDPVRAGADLKLDVRIRNQGNAEATGTVRLLVGNGADEVDATDVSLDGGAAETVALGYETYPVRRDVQFPVRVETEDSSDTRTVEVNGQN